MSRMDDTARWERMYRDNDIKSLPWYYSELDPDFETALSEYAFDEDGESTGSALDLCTGPGTQALAMADRGLRVTATDISISAVEKAQMLAEEHGLEIHFLENDILDNGLDGKFDFVFDRGCFHVFPPERRDQYVETVASLVTSGGYLFMKCFSYRETRKEGPYRLHPDEIKQRFEREFEIVSIDESSFHSDTLNPPPIALFSVMRRR